MSDNELLDRLVARELIGVILKGNGFFPKFNLTDGSTSRYYYRPFIVMEKKKEVKTSVTIRVSDHMDHHFNYYDRKVTINFLTLIATDDDSLHVRTKIALRMGLGEWY